MFTQITLSSLRKPLLLAALAVGSIAGTVHAGSEDFFNDPKPGPVDNLPYRPMPLRDEPKTAPAGHLSIEQVGQLLDTYYPGKNTITNNGDTYYTINIQRDTWKFHLIVSLSPNGNVLWVTAPLVSIDDPSKVSPAAMVNLLKKNADIGPLFFRMTNSNMLQLTEPIANFDLSSKNFQTLMEEVLNTIQKTEPLWSKDTLMPGTTPTTETQVEPAPAPVPAPAPAPVRNPLVRNPLAR